MEQPPACKVPDPSIGARRSVRNVVSKYSRNALEGRNNQAQLSSSELTVLGSVGNPPKCTGKRRYSELLEEESEEECGNSPLEYELDSADYSPDAGRSLFRHTPCRGSGHEFFQGGESACRRKNLFKKGSKGHWSKDEDSML